MYIHYKRRVNDIENDVTTRENKFNELNNEYNMVKQDENDNRLNRSQADSLSINLSDLRTQYEKL